MLFKTTIKTVGLKITSVVEASSQNYAASKAVVEHFGEGALFVPTGTQPKCGWVGPVHLKTSYCAIPEVTVKVANMRRIEEAAVADKIPISFFDDELIRKGIRPNTSSRYRYVYSQKEWLKSIVFKNLSEIHIRRWHSKTKGISYFSLKLVGSLHNTDYILHLNQQYGYGTIEDIVIQTGIIHNRLLVKEWLEINYIKVKDYGYVKKKADLYKSAV